MLGKFSLSCSHSQQSGTWSKSRRPSSSFVVVLLQGYRKDNTANRASDDKRKSKERDCRVNFPHPISQIQPPPSHPSHFCGVFLCSPLRVLKSGPEIPAVLAYSGEVAEQARKPSVSKQRKSWADVDEASAKGVDGNGKRCVRDRDERRDARVERDIISSILSLPKHLDLFDNHRRHFHPHVSPKQFISVSSA